MKVSDAMASKPACGISVGGMVIGAAGLAVGLIAIFGRFHVANVMSKALGLKGRIALAAAGGAVLAAGTAGLVANRVLNRKQHEDPKEQKRAATIWQKVNTWYKTTGNDKKSRSQAIKDQLDVYRAEQDGAASSSDEEEDDDGGTGGVGAPSHRRVDGTPSATVVVSDDRNEV